MKINLKRELNVLLLSAAIALGSVTVSGVALAEATSESTSTIQVATWNLCDQACEKDKGMGSAASRAAGAATTILESGADVVAMQEYNMTNAVILAPALGADWEVAHAHTDNLSMVFNKTVFSQTDAAGDDLPGGWFNNAQTEKHKRTAYQVLRRLDTDEAIVFVNMHMLWGANGSTWWEHRTDQARTDVAEITARFGTNMPDIYLGDMNSAYPDRESNGLSGTFLAGGEEAGSGPMDVFEGAGQKSVWKTADVSPDATMSSFNGGIKNRIDRKVDHIYLAPNMEAKKVEIIENLPASDHNLVVSTLATGVAK